MAAYPRLTTRSLRLQDKVGAVRQRVRQNKLPQLLFINGNMQTKKHNTTSIACILWLFLLCGGCGWEPIIKEIIFGICSCCLGMAGINMRQSYELNLQIRVPAVSSLHLCRVFDWSRLGAVRRQLGPAAPAATWTHHSFSAGAGIKLKILQMSLIVRPLLHLRA